jgi:large subunit ribosomal protein L13
MATKTTTKTAQPKKKEISQSILKTTKTTRPKLSPGYQREWFVFDASKQPMGRLATEAARLLMGKHKADFSKDVDTGACVVVINAGKAMLTGRKEEKKMYLRHSGRPGGLKGRTYKEQMSVDPKKPMYLAIKRMLPKNRLQDVRANNRLYIFQDENHNLTQKLIPAN